MDHAEQLNSVLKSLINNREEEASVTIHDYLVSKMREINGQVNAAPSMHIDDDSGSTDTDFESDDE